MIEVGSVVLKTTGRDAGKKGIVIEVIDDNYVMIDGTVRRRKCNIKHIEPTKEKADIKAKASEADVKSAMKSLGIDVTKSTPRKAGAKPTKQRKKKKESIEAKTEKAAKKPAKEAKPKVEAKETPKEEKKE